MTNKRKKIARALSEKTGMSYQAAINALAATSQLSEIPRAERSIQQLLAELGVTSAFGVVTGRSPAVGRSATLAIAVGQADQLAARPIHLAESTGASCVVSPSESRLLVDAGAAEQGRIQVIRAFTIDVHTISEQCESCRAWIWCFKPQGESSAEGTCQCGHRYRIVFDAEPDWGRVLDLRCTRCGTEHRMSQRHEDLNPWRHVNERQVLCNRCFNGDPKAELREMKSRTRMLAADKAPGLPIDEAFAAHNSEVARFHAQLMECERTVDCGEQIPEEVQRGIRDEAARLAEQRRELQGAQSAEDVVVLKDEFERRDGSWLRRRLTQHRRTGSLRQFVRLATAAEIREAGLEQ